MGALPDGLQADLRAAMAIELTTIPAYLYAFWSIKPLAQGGSQAGAEAARTIMSVVDEEMLHMGLVANVLNALGGTPALDDPANIPRYPGPLMRHPTTTAAQEVMVRLLPLSADAIALFMQIELPEWNPPALAAGQPPDTIAQFYEQIERQLTGDLDYGHGLQLQVWDNPGVGRLLPVVDQASACQALSQIVEQGEGLKQADHDDGQHELAHYWKFATIQQNLAGQIIDPATDVFPVIPNPDASGYTGAQQLANLAFNMVYSDLLDALQEVFSGAQPALPPDVLKPTLHYDAPTSYMDRLSQRAAALRAQGLVPGTPFVAGPTFEYIAAESRRSS